MGPTNPLLFAFFRNLLDKDMFSKSDPRKSCLMIMPIIAAALPSLMTNTRETGQALLLGPPSSGPNTVQKMGVGGLSGLGGVRLSGKPGSLVLNPKLLLSLGWADDIIHGGSKQAVDNLPGPTFSPPPSPIYSDFPIYLPYFSYLLRCGVFDSKGPICTRPLPQTRVT